MEIREIKIANESTYKKVTLTLQDDIFIFNNLTSEKAHAYEKKKYTLRPFFKLPLRVESHTFVFMKVEFTNLLAEI